LIQLESFSANAVEAVGGEAGVTPNLNRLSREGVLFTNVYANSFRTDRGLVSILNGYPAQPTTSIMKYPAKSQTLPSIARVLGEAGYRSDMLYGGDINFTNMQSYFFSSGYSAITADRDFPLSSRLSKWGANDDITLRWLYESIKERPANQPWMNTFLTLSSHEPFAVPYARLEDPYLNSVAFTDSCLGDFIDKVRLLPVWDNLLVVFVSDHGVRYPHNIQEHDPQRYHIPMLWVGGAVKEAMVIETLASQIDLSATLLNQLGLSSDDFVFSRDILDSTLPHYAFYTFHNGFGFIDENGKTVFDNEGDRVMLEESVGGSDSRLQKGKALLQTLYDDMGSR
jgi:phosphoglycerol transferase MdoB-like AlkP superfamily enzyme